MSAHPPEAVSVWRNGTTWECWCGDVFTDALDAHTHWSYWVRVEAGR